jgi:hypothetical protein
MHRLKAVVATAVALSIPASVAWIGVAQVGPAAAASTIQCKGLSGAVTGTITISKCKPSGKKGYKSGTGSPTSMIAPAGGKITWSNSGATTTVKLGAPTAVTPNVCTGGATEYAVSGTVTAASTTGVGIPAVGDAVTAKACVASGTEAMTLVKKTTFAL